MNHFTPVRDTGSLHEVVFNRVHHMAYKQRIRYLVEECPFDMGKLRIAATAE